MSAPEAPSTPDPMVYAWPQSVAAGDTVGIHASGPPGGASVEIARVGSQRTVVHRTQIELAPHPIPIDAVAYGCGWPAAATVDVDPTWPSGFYEVLVHRNPTFDPDWDPDVAVGFFVVRPAAADPSRPLLVLATNTWNAYNDVGGANLYTTFGRPTAATQVSFERPMGKGLLRRPGGPGSRVAVIDAPDPTMQAHAAWFLTNGLCEWVGSAGWPGWELPFVAWAERRRIDLDFVTNADLELHPDVLDGRRLMLSVGHDEYWTWGMRDTVESFIERGGNVAFFSGNTSCWQVRIPVDGSTMVAYKEQFEDDPVLGTDDEHLLTSLWSDALIGRPENTMTGLSFSRGGYHRIGRNVAKGAGGYTLYRPNHWVFAGTEAVYGDLVGAGSTVVGYECDGCEFTMVDSLPFPTGHDGTPTDLQILGLAPARPNDRDTALRPPPDDGPSEAEFIAWRVLGDLEPETVARLHHGHAVMAIRDGADGRGTVFTSGCTDWVWGLAGDDPDPVVERVTSNLLDRLTRPG